MKYKFKAGDKVRIINDGQLYSSYDDMARKMNLLTWKSGSLPSKWSQTEATIVAVELHHNTRDVCCGIQFPNGHQFILGEEGLDFTKTHTYSDDDIIKVDVKTLHSAYESEASGEHKRFIDSNFTFGGEVKVKHLRELHGMVCSRWKKIIETNHPELFEEDKYFDVSDFKTYINGEMYIGHRGEGEYKNKGFYLGQGTNWEIVTDSKGCRVLLPTKKQK